MKTIDHIKSLNDIASCQKGLLTTAQADEAGVSRYVLSRLEKNGNLVRLAKGVYRMGGAPSSREEDVLVQWLSLEPRRVPGSLSKDGNVIVATGATSAWLQQLGEIGPEPYEFCCSTRKQTQRTGLLVRKRILSDEDVIIAAGIPATSAARTVMDLIENGEDLDLVASVLSDALNRGLVSDKKAFADKVNRVGRRLGYPNNPGLYTMMQEIR